MSTQGLALEGVAKRYGESVVLAGVSVSLAPGRVRALVGENGAGKSTLVRIACGLVEPDTGTVSVEGTGLPRGDARAAIARGVGVVHQHFMLVGPMTVAENVALGHEPRKGPFGSLLDRARARSEVRALGEKYGLAVDPDARVESLGVGERQRVELLKVLYRGARYVLLDEPTAVLSPAEIQSLLGVIRGLAAGGAGVLFVSHKLDEVMAVADDVTALRRGRVVLERARGETSAAEIARAVVGGETPAAPPPRARAPASREGLAVEALRAPGLTEPGLTVSVSAGEVLGIAGVEGSGQRALADAIAGLERVRGGRVRIGGKDATDWSVAARRAKGLGFVPEDRETTGLLADLSIAENIALGDPALATGGGRVSAKKTREAARALIARYDVRPDDPDAPVRSLSGGNAQKVLIGRELSRSLVALVVSQPTRGVDIGAAAEVHAAILRARDEGVAVLLVSSDLDELRTLSDRVAVMRGGAIVGEMPARDASDAALGPLMVGA